MSKLGLSPAPSAMPSYQTESSPLLTSGNMKSEGIGTPSDIITFSREGQPSLEERFYNLFKGKTHGDFNPELYTNGGAKAFLEMAHGTKGYQQETGDLAVLKDNKSKISEFLENAKTIVLVGPGSCDKELELLRLAPKVKEVFIYELSPEFNEHAYWRVSQFAAQELGHSVDIKAYNCDFRRPPFEPSHGPASVICIGGLTNPENMPKESFPSGHYADFLESLKRLSDPRKENDPRSKILMSFTTASSEDQMRGIYDNAAFHKWILHPLNRLQRTGNVEGLKPEAFKYTGTYYETSGLFAHHIEATETQSLSLRFTDSQTGKERKEKISVFEGSRFNLLTSTGMRTDNLSTVARDVGLDTDQILQARDPQIFQRWQIFSLS